MPAGALLKAYPVIVEGRGLVLVVVRGDHRVNEIKLRNALGADCRPAQPDEFAQKIGPAGFIGPVGANAPVLLDAAVADGGYVTGANRPDFHLRGVEPGRDFAFERADVRTVEAGDTVNGQAIRIETAIEVGNIFKLGTRYSEPLGATYLDESGTVAADRDGLLRDRPGAHRRRRRRAARPTRPASRGRARSRRSTSSWSALGRAGSEEQAYADALYDELRALGADVLYDDRDLGARPEVRRRRAARLPAAHHRRQAHAVRRRAGAAGAPRPRDARRPARGRCRGGARAVADAPVGPETARATAAARPLTAAACSASTAPARRRPRRSPARRSTPGRSRTRSASRGSR